MESFVRDVMSQELRTVSPCVSLPDLDRLFLETGLSGFPVVEHDQVVGLVSRADVIRQIGVEQVWSEWIVDDPFHEGARTSAVLDEVGARVGQRLERMTVREIMATRVVTIRDDLPISAAARLLAEHRIHRLVVMAEGRPVGIVSSTDIVRWVATNLG